MKQLLFVLSLVMLFFACQKDNTNTPASSVQTPANLQNHTWLFDSSTTVTPNYSTTTYATADEQTIIFSGDTLVEKTGSSSVTYNTLYESTDAKLFYWLPGTVQDANMYMFIDSVSDSRLVTRKTPQSNQTITAFYHAR